MNRKDDHFFTIAHISDLHFESSTKFPPGSENVHLKKLIEDINIYSPDILCVTGDIAENPWREALRLSNLSNLGREADFSQWNSSLSQTFRRTLEFLKHACNRCAIESNDGLFVIPGNHDYRIQGIYGGFLGNKLRGVQATQRGEFTEVFGPYFRNSTILSMDKKQQWPIVVKIVCLDSNESDAFMNFATGAIPVGELKKLEYFEEKGSEESAAPEESAIEFRTCLIHHHPLPVVPAEALRERIKEAGIFETLRGAWQVLTGEQTNLFKNGGSFLFAALEAKVDLVMHGHQHRSWFSNIQYPTESQRRLLVAAAGSAGKLTGNCYRYSIYQLDVNGNIRVIERSTEPNPVKYRDRQNFSLYEYYEVRSGRREKLVRQLTDVTIPELKSKYGVAIADQATRIVKIREDGNARLTTTFKNLRASRDPVAEIPLRSVSTLGYRGYEFAPRIVIEDDPYNYYTTVHWKIIKAGIVGGEDLGCLVFNPPLHPDKPVSIKLQYMFCNAFEFVQEYRRAQTQSKAVDSESVTYVSRSIYFARFSVLVMFSLRVPPPIKPTLHAYNPSGGLDESETEHCTPALKLVPDEGLILFSVDNPLPGYRYEISWLLYSLNDYNEATFTAEGLQEYEKVSGAPQTPELWRKLLAELKYLKDGFSKPLDEQTQPLMDDSTELTLLVPVTTASGVAGQKAVDIRLKVFSSLNPSSGINLSGAEDFPPGVGIAGQAFRSRQPILFKAKAQLSAELYVKFPDQRDVHSALFCVPLPVRAAVDAKEAALAKDPIYAILCIGSFNQNSGLNQLMPVTPRWYTLTDYVRGAFNQGVFKILTEAKAGSII